MQQLNEIKYPFLSFLFFYSSLNKRNDLLTVVQVSRETGKNLLAVKQQGFLDLIITILRSLLSVLPILFIGRHIQGPEYTALPTFVLSCIAENRSCTWTATIGTGCPLCETRIWDVSLVGNLPVNHIFHIMKIILLLMRIFHLFSLSV